MKMKKFLALVLTVTLAASVLVLSPAATSVMAAGELTLTPLRDGYAANTASPDAEDKTILEIGYHPDNPLPVDTGYRGGDTRGVLRYARDILLSFDGTEINAGAVSSAVLKLTVVQAKNIGMNGSECESVNIAAYGFTGSWDENSRAWSNAPAVAAKDLAGISCSLSKDNSGQGTVMTIDLTDYIRRNPGRATYDFRLKASGSGFNFYSKENPDPARRPVLVIKQDPELEGSETYSGGLDADTYTEDSDDNRNKSMSGEAYMTIANTGKNGANCRRNGYIKVKLPKPGVWYDKAVVTLRASDTNNADMTISATPVSSDWDAKTLTYANAPKISGDAAATAPLPHSSASILNFITFDITDYVNSHPSSDGVYSFALTSDTAIAWLHTSRAELEANKPKLNCIYRDMADVTLHYVKSGGGEMKDAETYRAPVGRRITPDCPPTLNGCYFSTEETAKRNPFPYIVKSGKNDIYLVYEDKAISGWDKISVTTVQYEAPILPDELTVHFQGGSDEVYPVTWSQISAEDLAKPGVIKVMGTLQGIAADAVTATVTVQEITGIAIPTVTTVVGSYPALPAQLTATVDDGTEEGRPHSLAVVWDEVPASAYSEAGTYTVVGTIVSSGNKVNLTLLVEDEVTTSDSIVLADAFTMDKENLSPHNTNDLRISGKTGSPTGARADNARRTFLRFKGGFEPKPENDLDPIVTVNVRLWFNSISNDGTVTYKIYAIPEEYDDWEEETLTWNNAEDIVSHGEYISSVTIENKSGNKNKWVEFNVTPYVLEHRTEERLSFFVESDICSAILASKEAGQEHAPTLRTYSYIENAPVELRFVDEKNNDIIEPEKLTGKLGNPYTYKSSVPSPIYYPESDPSGIYYYNFTTVQSPPAEDKTDPDLHLDKLAEDGNVIYARYTRRNITSVESVQAETWQGIRPELPTSVTAVLDNGAKLTRGVVWHWEDVDFLDASSKDGYTVKGDVTDVIKTGGEMSEVKITDIPAVASIDVKQAFYGDPYYQTGNGFDLQPGETYRLSFELINTGELPDNLSEIMIHDGDDAYRAYDMEPEKFMDYLRGFGEGERAEVFFTAPESSNTLTLSLPDTVNFTVNYELQTVMGRGGDITIHYMAEGEEVYARPANVAFGEVYTLPEEYFTILDGAYIVTGIDEKNGDLHSLTGSVEAGEDGMNIYLLCSPSKAFTVNANVENVADSDGNPYTRSTVTAYNGTSKALGAAIIVARFSPDGKLISIRHNDITVPSNEPASVSAFSVPVDDDSYTALMVWDEISGLQPITAKIDSRNPSGMAARPSTGDGIIVPALGRSVTATDEQEGNEAVNILNRDLNSRWSAQAKGSGTNFDPETATPVRAVVDLGDRYTLHTVGLGFYQGKTRQARFSVEVSDDKKAWAQVISPRYSTGKTTSIEYLSFEPTDARYVRINGYGWRANEITDAGLVEKTGDWFSVTAFEAYGGLSETGGGHAPDEAEDFEGLPGSKLGTEPTSKVSWGADALNEMTYTDYTPAKGGSLYADIAKTPAVEGFAEGNTALHLYDNVDRDGTDGAGSVGAYHKLAITSEKYSIHFKWYVPNTIDGQAYNAQWAGVTLSSGRVRGGADTGNPVAFQLRLSPSGNNKMAFNIMRTITYNEGSQAGLLGLGTAFNANCVWDVTLDVDGAENSVVVTISDGTRTESAYTRYNLYNAERTMSQTWANSFINYIMFNTGAGGKCEMYIDDFSVTPTANSSDESGTTTFSENYNGVDTGTEIRGSAVANTTSALIRESGQSYTPSYGSMLGVSVASHPQTGGGALLLKDYVARDNDSVKGAGGVFAYVDIGALSTTQVSEISFDMYAPTAGEYAGFALGHGHNYGGDDQTHPLALQARFSPQSEGMQINQYPSIQYNKDNWQAFVGTGNNRLEYKTVWHFDITVNPVIGNITVSATDGSKLSSSTVSIPTKGNGSFTADWSKTAIDTLIFNTGAGTSTEMYIDNIEVRDTGLSKNSYPAVNGLVRYENEYGVGSGNKEGSFLVHGGQVGSRLGIARNQDPYYARFVERRGLADPDSVSIEVIDLPNCYVVPVTDGAGTIVTVQRYQDTDEFRQRATFNKVTSLKNVSSDMAYSYQWSKDHSLYLRNFGNYLQLSKDGQHSGENDPDGVNKACTFWLRNEAKNYVSDSFDGKSISGQWYKGYPWYANYHNHSAIHRDSNVVVDGGRVLLKATKVNSDDWIKNSSGQTGYNDTINGGTWKKYCAYTGVISVNNKVYNRGSYIEGSFKQPNSPRGYWTAFWLNGRDSWPPETDMFEYLSSKGTSTWYSATHGGSEGAGWQYHSSVGNMRTQYNTFAIDWGYNYIKMYVNGHLYFDRDNTGDVSVQKNMYLILNTGIGAWESEPDGSTVWDQGLECQWLRSYQYY